MISVDPQRLGPHPADTWLLIPLLNQDQEHALKRLTEVARSTERRLNLKRGDLLFVNKWAIIHRREAYKDEVNMPRQYSAASASSLMEDGADESDSVSAASAKRIPSEEKGTDSPALIIGKL
ncbi:hypothetical protein E4U41_000086 [Claviceps citrina]|nr:hypothetical protein E4U41_000086 [Claviceps citrina]